MVDASFVGQLKAAAERGIKVKLSGFEVDSNTGNAGFTFHLTHEMRTPALTGAPSPNFDPWAATEDEVMRYGIGSAEFAAWATAALLKAWRPDIEKGNGVIVLRALSVALTYGLKVPGWLTEAYRRCMRRFDQYEACGLDEAFRNQPLTQRERKKRQRHRHLLERVGDALCTAIEADPDRAIDPGLFEEVGERLGIGKTLCRELYDKAVADGRQDLPSFKRFVQLTRKQQTSGE